jgi:trk system potassium uptake protein TrkA
LTNPQIQDFVTLADGHTIVELVTPSAFHRKSVKSIGLRAKYGVNLVAIKRKIALEATDGKGEPEFREVVSLPTPDDVIQEGDVLVLAGSDQDLNRLPRE